MCNIPLCLREFMRWVYKYKSIRHIDTRKEGDYTSYELLVVYDIIKQQLKKNKTIIMVELLANFKTKYLYLTLSGLGRRFKCPRCKNNIKLNINIY